MPHPTEQPRPSRIALLLENDRQLPVYEAVADALCRRGCDVHLAVQGDTVKDREGALGRLGEVHLSLTAGQAPARRDRWSSLIRETHDRIDPVAVHDQDTEEDEAAPRERKGGLGAARLVLSALPACPDIATYLDQLDLDLMVVTPHTSAWSGRLDYLLAARRLGIPVVPLVFAPTPDAAPSALTPLLDPVARPVALAVEPAEEAPDAAAEAIVRALSLSARPRPAAWSLRVVIELILGVRQTKRLMEDRLGADMRRGLVIGLLMRAGGSLQDIYARWIFPRLNAVLLAMLPKSRVLFRDLMSEQLDPAEMARLGWVEDVVAAARRGSGPILLGPWVGGVGHEILYWIPMLRWFRKYYRIDKSRLVIISRGGVRSWYTGVGGRYLDVFDLVPNKRQQYRDDALRQANSNEMPLPAGKIEKEIYHEAAQLVGAERYNSLHPQMLFKLFKRRWVGLAGDSFVDRYTRLQPIDADVGAAEKRLGPLPADYVAVNFAFSEELPDTAANRDLVTGFIRRLAEQVPVFLIDPLVDADRGPMASIEPGPRVHRIEKEIRPSEILAVQSGVIAGARALVGVYGGMTYLAQALGVLAVGVRAPDAVAAEATAELSMIRPDPEGGELHMIGLEQLDQLIPALAGAPKAGRAAALKAAAAAAAISAARPRPDRTLAEEATR